MRPFLPEAAAKGFGDMQRGMWPAIWLIVVLALIGGSGCERRHAAQARRQALALRQALIQDGVHLYGIASPQSGRHLTLRRFGKLYKLVTPDGRTQASASLRRFEQTVYAKSPGGTRLGKTALEDHAIALLDDSGSVLLRLRVEADGLHLTLLGAQNQKLYTFELTPSQEVIVLPVCEEIAPAAKTVLERYLPKVAPPNNCNLSPLVVTSAPSPGASRGERLTLSSLPDPDHPKETILTMEPNSGLHPLGFAILNLSQLPLTQLLPLALHADRLGLPAPPPKSS